MDGLNCFKQLFPNDDELVDYVIRNTLFFKKDIVFQQARVYRQAIRMGEAIPVRYTSKGAFFRQHEVKTTTPRFRRKKLFYSRKIRLMLFFTRIRKSGFVLIRMVIIIPKKKF